MKPTGIVRKVDELGRIVLPLEMKRNLGLEIGMEMEIYAEDGNIVIEKHIPKCVFCSHADNLIQFKDKNICSYCLEVLKQI